MLSGEQKAALWDEVGDPLDGLNVLSARPGTGKTTTLTRYCLDLAAAWNKHHEPWQGMAVLSYTNVAKDEVQARVKADSAAHNLLRRPHFMGTLDAFVNQMLFLPHGAGAMAYPGGRPTLVGEPFRQWRPSSEDRRGLPDEAFKPVWFDCYTLDKNAEPIRIDEAPRPVSSTLSRPAAQVTEDNKHKITAMKRHVWSRGKALQADANHLGLQVLVESESLSTALAARYPVVIVDEAQDMTETQHAILDRLIQAGLTHIVLVGDENQAIYEWNTARPDLFTRRATAQGWHRSTLQESRRCSPAICDYLSALAGEHASLTPSPGAKNSHYSAAVTVSQFEKETELIAVREAINAAADLLKHADPHEPHGVKTIAVIARSREDTARLQADHTGIKLDARHRTVWDTHLTKPFLKSLHHLAQGETTHAVRAYEKLLTEAGNHHDIPDMRTSTLRRFSSPASDNAHYRTLLFDDLELLARVARGQVLRISDGRHLTELPLRLLTEQSTRVISNDCASFLEAEAAAQDRLLADLFTARDERTRHPHPEHLDTEIIFATTHATKGETYDAVIFYTKHRTSACGCQPKSEATWRGILTHPILACETKRIAYVACSRAAQALTILTTAHSATAWRNHLTATQSASLW